LLDVDFEVDKALRLYLNASITVGDPSKEIMDLELALATSLDVDVKARFSLGR